MKSGRTSPLTPRSSPNRRRRRRAKLNSRVEGSFGRRREVCDASSTFAVAGCAGDRARVAVASLHLRPVSSVGSERETRGDETLGSATHIGRPAGPSRYLVEQRRHSAGTAEGARRKTIPDRRGSGRAQEKRGAALRGRRGQRRGGRG